MFLWSVLYTAYVVSFYARIMLLDLLFVNIDPTIISFVYALFQ